MTDQPRSIPDPDAAVRPARASDAEAVAHLTVAWWHRWYAEAIPAGEIEGPSLEDVREAWALSITAPPSPRHRVLVALQRDEVVGYAVAAPADPGLSPHEEVGEIVDLVVAAERTRLGHGSRLLAASVDHLRSHGFAEVGLWCLTVDAARRAFLESAGFATSGAVRRLDMGEGTAAIEQVQLVAALA